MGEGLGHLGSGGSAIVYVSTRRVNTTEPGYLNYKTQIVMKHNLLCVLKWNFKM